MAVGRIFQPLRTQGCVSERWPPHTYQPWIGLTLQTRLLLQLYEDLDEIIARHVNPIAANVREILNYKYYFQSSDREEIEKHLQLEKENSPNRIP